MNIKLYAAFLSFSFLSACSMHTINSSPKPSITALNEYSVIIETHNIQSPWWGHFNRPLLDELIQQSLEQNYDIAQSVAVLKQARALSRQTRSQLFPEISITGNTDKEWEGGSGQRGTTEVGTDLSWDVDIWNRIGSATTADNLEAEAKLEDVDTVKLLTSAQIANAYFGAVAANRSIRLLKDQLRLDRDLEKLLQQRFKNGIGTNVELLQQKARVSDSEKLVPLAEADLAVFENRLDVLVGVAPDGQNRIPNTETLNFSEKFSAIQVPASLLLNRPDLRSARAQLVAADADIAVAIAQRLPNITLDGTYSFSDTQNYTGPVALIMGTFVQPLLDWGERKAEVERNKALYEERLAAYTQLYLEAIEDVENALVKELKQRDFLKKLESQKNILQQTVTVAKERYTQGVDDYMPVIDALKELRTIERDLITEQLNLINIRIDLFRAIGGPIDNNTSEEKTHDAV